MNKRHYEHTLPNIRGSLSNTYYDLTINNLRKKELCLWEKRKNGTMKTWTVWK